MKPPTGGFAYLGIPCKMQLANLGTLTRTRYAGRPKSADAGSLKGFHYCDLIMTPEEAAALKLVQELQAAGEHPLLADVFKSVLEDTWCSNEPDTGSPG